MNSFKVAAELRNAEPTVVVFRRMAGFAPATMEVRCYVYHLVNPYTFKATARVLTVE